MNSDGQILPIYFHMPKNAGTYITHMFFSKLQTDDDIFWFTFTRNPWDRAVSFYNMYINWNCNHLFKTNSLVVDKEPKITFYKFFKVWRI